MCCSNGSIGGTIAYNWSDPTLVVSKSKAQAALSEAQSGNLKGVNWKAVCTAVGKMVPMLNCQPASKC